MNICVTRGILYYRLYNYRSRKWVYQYCKFIKLGGPEVCLASCSCLAITGLFLAPLLIREREWKKKKCPVYGGNNREPPSGQVGKRDDQLTSQATIIDVIKTNAITQLLNKWNTVLWFSVEWIYLLQHANAIFRVDNKYRPIETVSPNVHFPPLLTIQIGHYSSN